MSSVRTAQLFITKILTSPLVQLPNGSTIALPKVVTAKFGSDPSKRTVCVYGHVDVQPAKKEDGWATDPYELTEINGNPVTYFNWKFLTSTFKCLPFSKLKQSLVMLHGCDKFRQMFASNSIYSPVCVSLAIVSKFYF